MSKRSNGDAIRRDATLGALVGLGILLIGVIWLSSSGFGPYNAADGGARLPTWWDWMELLIVPAVLAGGALWFNRSQRERELRIAEEASKAEHRVTEERRQQATLDSYISQMSKLMTENGLLPYPREAPKEVCSVAQALTIAAIHSLDSPRSSQLFAFLYSSRLNISLGDDKLAPINFIAANFARIDAKGANWASADLSGANFESANLSEMSLSNCRFRHALLKDADLSKAFLWGADLGLSFLENADLTDAYLWKAKLNGAYMRDTKLSQAFLFEADLTDALLINANLVGAEAWTLEQLSKTKALDGSKMPDGARLKLRPEMAEFVGTSEGLSFEEWMGFYLEQHGGDETTLRNPTENGVDSYLPQNRDDETAEALRSIIEDGM